MGALRGHLPKIARSEIVWCQGYSEPNSGSDLASLATKAVLDGDNFVIIASRGGTPAHPVWFLNLEAQPECDLQVGAKALRARARIAEGEERERLWKQMAELYPPYDDYQKNAGARVIPLVILDPI